MHTTFWQMFADRAETLEAALISGNASSFSEVVDELAGHLANTEPKLNLNIGGPDPFRLSILYLPGAKHIAASFVDSCTVADHWEISIGLPEFDPLESVHVEDDSGDSLNVQYADLEAKVLPPRDGLLTIVCSLRSDFDPAGERAHLYQALAENVVFTILGAWPQELAKVILLPRSQTGDLLPLQQLRQQWLDVACADDGND